MTLITTTYGDMDDSLLERKDGAFEDDNELTTWVEYWKDAELVHRSVHVTLKKSPTYAVAEAAQI
jgi:hypothetical protein